MAKISRLLRPSIKAISPPPFLCTSNSHTSTKRKYTHSLPPTLSDILVARFGHTWIVPSRLLGSKMKATSQKRYALLLAARDSDYVKEVYGGYFNVFVAAFAEDGEKWDLYRVVDGEFPDMDELHRYDGFVISGSPHDAYGKDCWILKLCLLLQTLDAMDKKILGICFGHQVLCRALGGKVGKAHTGWDIGLRKVRIVKDLFPCGYLNKMDDIPPALSIIECHQDEVWELPAGAEVIAFSDKTGVEMFAVGDHILGIQGHPEYTKDILFNLIDRLLNNGCIEKGFAENAKFALEIAEPDRKCWERICRNFLKGR